MNISKFSLSPQPRLELSTETVPTRNLSPLQRVQLSIYDSLQLFLTQADFTALISVPRETIQKQGNFSISNDSAVLFIQKTMEALNSLLYALEAKSEQKVLNALMDLDAHLMGWAEKELFRNLIAQVSAYYRRLYPTVFRSTFYRKYFSGLHKRYDLPAPLRHPMT